MNALSGRPRSWLIAGLGVALGYVLLAYVAQVLPAPTDGIAASQDCIEPRSKVVAAGRSPEGHDWAIKGSVEENGGCSSWLLKMEFLPSEEIPGSWARFWDIPANGHLPASFPISAQDEAQDDERSFSGIVGSSVRFVVLTTSDGRRIRIEPKLSGRALRKSVWLRGFRYLMVFYPLGEPIKLVELLDARGEKIRTVKGNEGRFGPLF